MDDGGSAVINISIKTVVDIKMVSRTLKPENCVQYIIQICVGLLGKWKSLYLLVYGLCCSGQVSY